MGRKMSKICYVLAILCVVYCAGVVLTKAAGTKFFLIWLFGAAILAGIGYGLGHGLFMRLPFWVRAAAAVVLAAGAVWFCFVEGLILSGFGREAKAGIPYIIVLGAQIKENGPSVALARRLDCAYAYLVKNPDTVCVVSGGQGSNEPVSEAEGMRKYLEEKGIAKERIVLEDASRDTQQNLSFSRKLIPEGVTRVGIVTSNFHVYRSVRLAKKQGFSDAEGLAATSGLYFLPNNMLREFFGVMKDWVFGNMELFG